MKNLQGAVFLYAQNKQIFKYKGIHEKQREYVKALFYLHLRLEEPPCGTEELC